MKMTVNGMRKGDVAPNAASDADHDAAANSASVTAMIFFAADSTAVAAASRAATAAHSVVAAHASPSA